MLRRPPPLLIAAVFAVVVLITIAALSATANTFFTLAIEALPLTMWLFAGFGFGSTVFHVLRIDATGTLRAISATALGLGAIGVVIHLLGLAGAMNSTTAWTILALAGLAGVAEIGWSKRDRRRTANSVEAAAVSAASSRARAAEAAETAAVTRSPWRWLLLVIAIPVGVSLAAATVPPGILWGDEPHGYDVVEYHLQVPREWYEAGKISPLPHNVFSFLPLLTEMHYLLAMHLRGGPWAGMYLAQLMHAAMVWMSVAAVYGLVGGRRSALGGGEQIGGRRLSVDGKKDETRLAADRRLMTADLPAIVAALACAAPPWLALLAGVAYDDGALMLFSALAIGWLLCARRWNDAPIAGVFAGLACSSKLSAAPLVIVIGPIVFLSMRLLSSGWHGLVPQAVVERDAKTRPGVPDRATRKGNIASILAPLATYFIAATIVFSPQAIRNFAWAGNPLFPEAAELLGGPFSPGQVERWRVAHTPTETQRSLGGRLAAAWGQIAIDFRYGYAPPILAFAVFVFCSGGRLGRLFAFRQPGRPPLHQRVGRGSSPPLHADGGDEPHPTFRLSAIVLLHLLVWLFFTHLQGRFFVAAIPLMAMIVAATPWPRITSIVMSLALLGGVAMTLARYDAPGGTLAIGLTVAGIDNVDELRPLQHDVPADRTLALIGDASAFFYKRPMTSLIYRTVFNLDDRAADPIAAYLRDDPRGKDATLLIDPGELSRFAKTYRNVPTPSAEVGRDGNAYLLRR